MANIHRFLRSISPNDMRAHLRLNGMAEPPGVKWNAEPDEFCKSFLTAGEDFPDQERTRLFAEIERITDMSDEVGQAAILGLPDWQERLGMIDGAHRRAHWLYVQSREAFRQAEEIRYAEENQNAQRLWDGFVGPLMVEVKADKALVAEFRSEIGQLLGAGRVYVETFGRIRRRKGEPDRGIKQITIYSEDVPEDEVVFSDGGGVSNQARKPVRETAIIYEPESGTIEVVGRVCKIRENIAALFARILLGVEISGERLPPRRIDLMPLLYTERLAHDEADGIARVKMTMLALSTFDGRLNQRFETPFSDPETLHVALANEYGHRSPLTMQARPWMARIEVQLEPELGRKSGKKINIGLCVPNKCSLRGKTENERLLLNKYLRRWGLLRGADA